MEHALELHDLQVAFGHLFDHAPTHLIRAPGRVNLIGEHTDYNGLPVFPLAISREVRLACRARNDDTVRVVSTISEYGPREFRLTRDIERYRAGDWGNYVKAAAQAVARGYGVARGMDALVDSNLPAAAGLSSSSALVVGTAWSLLTLEGKSVDRQALAAVLAEGERYVGLQGGGMDQAVIAGARPGHATRIDFGPLRLAHVPLPAGWTFMVAHSLARAEKSGDAAHTYNERTRQCQDALAIVRKALGVSGAAYADLLLQFDLTELLETAEGVLGPVLFRRFRHVVTEGRRVSGAERAMRAGDLFTFGELMNASHESLRDDYEVSTAALDDLVSAARDAGAVGARLTGAGLGGCALALCRAGESQRVLRGTAQRFYRPRGHEEGVEDLAFRVQPAGAVSATAYSSDQVDLRKQPEDPPS